MATNTLLVTDRVLNEALMVLENSCVFGNMVDRQYSDEFNQSDEKIGLTLRVKKPPRFTYRSGATASAQNYTETSVTIGPIAQGGVDMEITSLETLSSDVAWKDFSVRKLKPAIAKIANQIDYTGLALYKDVPNWVGTAGTTPSTAAVLLAAQQKMSEMGAPIEDRYAVVNPAANAGLVDGLKGLFHTAGKISDQFTKGMMGTNTLGYEEIAMDQNVNNHIGGLEAGTPLVNGATQTGSTIAIDGWTASTTIKAGTVFTLAGVYAVNPQNLASTGALQQFVVTADTTATGGGATATLPIFPAITTSGAFQTVTTSPADNAVVTMVTRNSTTIAGGDPQNLAFHRNAFTLAFADLPLPGGVHYAARKMYKNYALRVISAYDVTNDKMICRFDVAFAWKSLYPELACRISG